MKPGIKSHAVSVAPRYGVPALAGLGLTVRKPLSVLYKSRAKPAKAVTPYLWNEC